MATCPGGGCGLGWGWCGLLALCVLMLRVGSLLIWRSRVRASVRRSLLGSRRRVWSNSPGLSSLGSRWCGRSCILVVGSVRRIGCSLFPLGCDRDRPNLTLTGSVGPSVVVGFGYYSPTWWGCWSGRGRCCFLRHSGQTTAPRILRRSGHTSAPVVYGGVFLSWQARQVRSCGCILKPQSAQLLAMIICLSPRCTAHW
jgi:hypothetical protein